VSAPRHLLAIVKDLREQIGAVGWYAPQYFKPVHKALEQLRTDPDLPPGAEERVIAAAIWAGMPLDIHASNEHGGPNVLQAEVRHELDALERMLSPAGPPR
jgi:hypothetical protein